MNKELRDVLIHLRFPFSFLLLPVYLFALSQAPSINVASAIWVFVILHLLVYPSSNAYNSYHDKDTESIGGLLKPPPINKKMLLVSNVFDSMALVLSLLFVNPIFFAMVFLYILASRIYSNRNVRIKKYPIKGFVLVFVFQGVFTFYMALLGINTDIYYPDFIWAGLAASFQIGAVYPLTQIYQHKADEQDGVITLSKLLGYQNTFLFSAISFILATLCYIVYFKNNLYVLLLLMLFQLPIISYFSYWFLQVRKSHSNASFIHTMRFNLIAAISLNLFYLLLVVL